MSPTIIPLLFSPALQDRSSTGDSWPTKVLTGRSDGYESLICVVMPPISLLVLGIVVIFGRFAVASAGDNVRRSYWAGSGLAWSLGRICVGLNSRLDL